jgi:glyoxalase family protein
MNPTLLGIHHVTAVARDPRHNLEFYTRVLGLRCVKRTVDFDELDTYHFYFGDAQGTPGTILTFFPWSNKPAGRLGTGQASACAFTIPETAIGYWQERLSERGVTYYEPVTRFEGTSYEEQVIVFRDEDGLCVELVADRYADGMAMWAEGGVPAEAAVRGLHSVTLAEQDASPTTALLTQTLGFTEIAREDNRTRYATGEGGAGKILDVLHLPNTPKGEIGPGTIHHVALRVQDDTTQQAWRSRLLAAQLDVTDIRDRKYFHSLYFDEPGGVLFEIATDLPGFAVDEPLAELGMRLQLPPWLEPQRDAITRELPSLT